MADITSNKTLRSRVLMELGSPRNLPDWRVRDALADAAVRLRGVASVFSKVRRNITTVANQQAYALGTDVIKVTDVLWRPGWGNTFDLGSFFGSGYGLNLEWEGVYPGAIERSLDAILELERHQALDIGASAGTWEVLEGSIYLIPVPTAADQTVPYFALIDGGESTFDARHRELLVKEAAADLCLVLAAASKSEVDFDAGQGPAKRSESQFWMDFEERLRARTAKLAAGLGAGKIG